MKKHKKKLVFLDNNNTRRYCRYTARKEMLRLAQQHGLPTPTFNLAVYR